MTLTMAAARRIEEREEWIAARAAEPNDGGCWEWPQGKGSGYGQTWDRAAQKMVKAHRVLYRLFVGEIPEGMELDHLCHNSSCVNPAHLEPVTHAENVRRGHSGWHWKAKTHCPQGHPYAGDNLIVWRGRRSCRECARRRSAAWKRRQQEKP
jgi:hypothetical protein